MPVAADFDTLIRQLGTTHAWWQVGVMLACFAIAWLSARTVRAKLPADLQPGALKIGAGSVHRLVLPLVALLLVWIGRFVVARYQPVPLLNIAIPLIASYLIIRLALYLLRHLLAPSALLKASERVVGYGVWAVVALYLTGVLPEIAGALDDISFMVGKQKITLLLIVHALFWATFTIVVALSISRIIEQRLLAAESLDMSMRVFAGKLIRAGAAVVAILIALPLMGIDITVLSVFGGALGVGLGLGLQKIASNYVSGFVILLDRSIRPGDLVTIADRQGVVADIKARYTVLRGLDGTEAIIPNDTIISNTVLNHSYSDRLTVVRTPITVAYNSDIDKVISLLLDTAKAQPRVLEEPPANVQVRNLGDNGIELELNTWIRDAEQGQGNLRSDLLLAAWKSFQASGVEVPFPQREVRILPTTPEAIPLTGRPAS